MKFCNYGCPCLGQLAAPLGGLPSKTRSGAETKAPEYHNSIIMVRFPLNKVTKTTKVYHNY